uniref:NAC domain-containing protein n=1 Tax=Tanacetum cinerariifolium TaxID=118510 RepID=A0A6L2JF96_TANCI|nr:NAC domain-containing protein [Tanacetum cinerariifolium]
MSSYNHFGCKLCGGPFNGGNCLGCSSVESGNDFIYDPNPYSYNEIPNFFNQPPQHQYETYSCELCGGSPHYGFDCQTQTSLIHEQDPCSNQNFSNDQSPYYSTSLPQQFHCCEYCGGLHDSSNCQSRNHVFYEPNPCNDFDSSGFDQPLEYPIVHSPLHEMSLQELISYMTPSITETANLNSVVYLESNDDIEVTLNKEQFLSDHYIAHATLPAYTPSLPFLATMKPIDTLLMGDEVISNISAREIDEFIKSSVDDLVSILKESEVTSNNNFECDMPTPLPTTDVREENFDINSPLGEYVVDFLMENEDIAGLTTTDVKRLFSHLVKNLSSTKKMSNEPLGDDSKPRSYDVTFSNLIFDFNDDFTLCIYNLLFDEEFEDISSLDPPKSALLNYEPLGNPDSVSRSFETSDLNLEELTAEIGLDNSIPTKINDGYYDSEGDILFLKHLLIEETFSNPTPLVLPKKSTLLVTPPPTSKQSSLKEVRMIGCRRIRGSGFKIRGSGANDWCQMAVTRFDSTRLAQDLSQSLVQQYKVAEGGTCQALVGGLGNIAVGNHWDIRFGFPKLMIGNNELSGTRVKNYLRASLEFLEFRGL